MDEVGEGPDHRYADKGNAEQDDVQEADAQDVREPHSPAVHHSSVGVHLAVCRAHVHGGRRRYLTARNLLYDTQRTTETGLIIHGLRLQGG